MAAPPARERLARLADFFVEDIMSMSEEEIDAEMRELGLEPEAEAARTRRLFEEALAKHEPEPSP